MALLSESLRMRRDLADRTGVAGGLESVAAVQSAREGHGRAARLLGAAARLREDAPAPLSPAERAITDAALASVRFALGDEAFEAAWAEGRAMTLEQAVAYALDEEPPA